MGASLAEGLPVNWPVIGKIVLTWVVSPALAGVLAVGTYIPYKRLLNRIKHIKILELTQKWLAFTASAYASFNLGANELANVIGLADGGVGGVKGLLAVALGVGALTFSYEVMMTVGRDLAPSRPDFRVFGPDGRGPGRYPGQPFRNPGQLRSGHRRCNIGREPV